MWFLSTFSSVKSGCEWTSPSYTNRVGEIKNVSVIFHYNTVLYDGRNIISKGLPMRHNIGTLRMDFAHFSPGKPHEKCAKSIHWVPILSLMGNPLEIIHISHGLINEQNQILKEEVRHSCNCRWLNHLCPYTLSYAKTVQLYY
jgi:hypothetical protein